MPVGAEPSKRTDKDWQAVSDAEALARAEIIKADPARLKIAIEWAKELSRIEQEESVAMTKIAGLDA